MLPLRPLQPLPYPSFDDPTLIGLAKKGFAWAEGSVEGAQFRWLSPPDWAEVGKLPEQKGGFAPAMGFVHKPTGAVAGLRYGRAAWAFDPGDFLDVADPRPFDRANAYVLDGTLVAERVGRNGPSLIAAAAHRLGHHVFLIGSEAPVAGGEKLMEALSVLNSGLRIKAEPLQTATEVVHRLRGLALRFSGPARSEVVETAGTAVVTTPYGSHRSEVILRVEKAERTLAEALAQEEKAVAAGGCPLRAESLRFATLERVTDALAGPVLVENLDSEDGRELALVAAVISSGGLLVVRGLYPGPGLSKEAWLAARYALARLLRTLEPLEA